LKIFAAKGYHLAQLAVPAKLVYTLFLVFVALGIWTSYAIYAGRIGTNLTSEPGKASVQERYVARSPAAVAPAGGPELDLGGDDPAPKPESRDDAKSEWVLDVFHQHLFSVAVVYLVLAHLFMLTRLHPALAGGVILLAGMASLLHVLAPVVIHKTGSGFWLMPASGAAMGLTWSAMALWSLVAMWFCKPPVARVNGD
jgi:hypothetical protein